jgi:deoxycytidine triphosphate deaminase
MRTAKQLVEQGIIYQVGSVIKEENVAQHGIDLDLIEVHQILGGGMIPEKGKTKIGPLEKVELKFDKDSKTNYWILAAGVYDVKFKQGCDIPADMMMLIRQRSSLLRNGTIIHSSVFDAGFQTKNIGTVMVVNVPILIEYGARICQIYGHDSEPVQNLYDGQFQNDKQRDEKTN